MVLVLLPSNNPQPGWEEERCRVKLPILLPGLSMVRCTLVSHYTGCFAVLVIVRSVCVCMPFFSVSAKHKNTLK